jgi:hypothetical protein
MTLRCSISFTVLSEFLTGIFSLKLVCKLYFMSNGTVHSKISGPRCRRSCPSTCRVSSVLCGENGTAHSYVSWPSCGRRRTDWRRSSISARLKKCSPPTSDANVSQSSETNTPSQVLIGDVLAEYGEVHGPKTRRPEAAPPILRHTCPTMLLQLGVSVYDVAGVLGATEDVIRRTCATRVLWTFRISRLEGTGERDPLVAHTSGRRVLT